jgi:hypothetical protein
MSIIRSAALIGMAALGATTTGCSSSGRATASADPVATREQRAVDDLRLKQNYKDIVMGTDVKGETLVVYVDVNNLYSMDEQAEDALRSQTLEHWKRIWSAAHPHRHMKLRLSLRDYYGNELTGDTARV